MTQDPAFGAPEAVAIHRWMQACSDVPQGRILWADSSSPWPSISDGPWISLRDLGESEEMPYTGVRRRVLSFASIPVTSISGNQLLCSHSLGTGDGPVRVVGDDLPGLDDATDYWGIRLSSSAISLASSFLHARAGSAIVLSGGALPISITSTAATVRYGSEAEEVTVRPSVRELSIQVMGLGAMPIARTIATRGRAPQIAAILSAANVGIVAVGGIQNLSAALDAATFLPRAALTARLSISQCHVDNVGLIETTETMGTTT